MKTSIFKLICLIILCGCTDKNNPITVTFTGEYSEQKWAIKDLNKELPGDWSEGYLSFDVKSTTPQRFEVKLYDAGGIRKMEILPFQNVQVRVSIPMKHFQKMNTQGMDLAQIWKTPRPGYWIGFTGEVGSVNNIDSLGIAMVKPIGSPSLEVNNFRISSVPEDSVMNDIPVVDEFGQWIPAEWTGKAKSLSDLQAAWNEEEKSLSADNPGVSEYGGFLDSKAKATGFFRVEQINGKWWFIDPSGHYFYSTGSCCIAPGTDLSRVQGREKIFTELPPDFNSDAPRNRMVRGEITSFYSWNLFRRFGEDWYEKWKDLTVRRMNSWGLTTIANWSDPSLGSTNHKPYVLSLRGWGIEDGLMGMPDVYADGYAAMVDSAASSQCSERKNDPYLIGYFIGNEPPWPEREGDLVNEILTGKATPMQAELKKFLLSGDTPEQRKAFVYSTYAKFIKTVNAAIRKYDPNHLNLGLRFGGYAPEEIIKASVGFDVFSFNHYGYDVDHAMIQRIYDIAGLPMLIGEFHFGVPGRGLAPGLAQTSNYEERGNAYRYYVENVAVHPAMIGTHWFQWIDQPSTGRFDGENYNIGMVDVTDRPYSDLANASRETFKHLRKIHSGNETPVSRKALTQ
jgi:hypothetical protein